MIEDFTVGPELEKMVQRIVESYNADARTRHIDRGYLPSRIAIVSLTQSLLELIYPGFVGRQHLTQHNVAFHVGDLLPRIAEQTYGQVMLCLSYLAETKNEHRDNERVCDEQARDITVRFLDTVPDIRELLAGDVQAAYDGDPAAINLDEIILAYPGLLAISVHRLAHAFYSLNVPLMPRIMSEWAHAKTGIDIHPGARIGKRFFIDHGTGVVIGETTDIAEDVKIYQGVTLGALSFPKDEEGHIVRGAKRHPSVEDHVTIYANAIVLGGETVIGANSVIGGSVFVTSSVPPDSVVTFKPPELRVRDNSKSAPKKIEAEATEPPGPAPNRLPDYQI